MELPALTYIDCTLPSRGVLYGDKIPGGLVQIRKLTVGEDIIIQTTSSGVEMIAKIVAACCKLPNGFNPSDLLLTDRMAVLVALRMHSFGLKYDAPFNCTECGALNKAVIDLGTMVEKPTTGPLVEPVEVVLKQCGMRVGLRFLRGSDEEAIARISKRRALKSNDNDESMLTRMALQIVAINDEKPTQDEKERFVRSLHLFDSQDLQAAIDERESGIDLAVHQNCEACAAVNERTLPFNGEFFRPSRRPA